LKDIYKFFFERKWSYNRGEDTTTIDWDEIFDLGH
jgi:hypothetical protein